MLLNKRVKSDLAALSAELRQAAGAVPARARRYHALLGDLAARADALLSRRMWIDDEVFHGLREALELLYGIAPDLAQLCLRTEELLGELQQLEQRAAEVRDAEFAAWLRARLTEWRQTLGRLGVDCARRADLLAERDVLGLTESELRRGHLVARWFLRAEAVLAVLGTDLAAAGLAAHLPALARQLCRDNLVHEEATRAWIERLHEAVTPLEELAREVQDPPKELKTLGDILADLWGWSRQLHDQEAQVEQLEERRNFVARDWKGRSAEEIRTLTEEAEALRARLRESARARRAARLQELEEGVADLSQACGPQPDLDARLAGLQAKSCDRPQLFRDWMSAWDREAGFFRAIATNHQRELEERLAQLVDRLGEGLADLRAQPLSDAVRQEADALEQKVGRLAQVSGVEEILRTLRGNGRIDRELTELAGRARQELADLSNQQEELRARHRALQAEAARVEVAVPDLAERIEALAQGSRMRSLEEARRFAAALTAEVAAGERDFAGRCRELLAAAGQAAGAAGAALRSVALGAALPPFPELAAAAGPAEAAAALLAARGRAAELTEQIAAQLALAEARRLRLAADLAAVRLESLGPSERESAEQLRRELDQGSWAQAQEAVERLLRLAGTVDRSSLFLARLREEEGEARQKTAELRRRLTDFEEEQLPRYCRELAERATGLLYGIPETPRSWRDVRYQLQLAQELLERIDGYARRRAAREVESAAGELRALLRRRLDPARRAEIQALLGELDAAGHGALPPAALRMRLRNAAQLRRA